MWRELAEQAHAAEAEGEHVLEEALGEAEGAAPPAVAKSKTLGQALIQILIADLTMSLDNVLAVAGAAHAHPWVMVAGLLLSIALMGVVAGWIAKLLHRFRWLGYLGLVIVFGVACNMIWEGHRSVVMDLNKTPAYNAAMPQFLDITPKEEAHHRARKD
jgi:predicted tellurium resistance membrane protein TerC